MEENMTPEMQVETEDTVLTENLTETVAETDSTEETVLEENLSYEITSDGEMSGLTEQQRKRAEIIDNLTTALLILILISPFAILLYILLWFVL